MREIAAPLWLCVGMNLYAGGEDCREPRRVQELSRVI